MLCAHQCLCDYTYLWCLWTCSVWAERAAETYTSRCSAASSTELRTALHGAVLACSRASVCYPDSLQPTLISLINVVVCRLPERTGFQNNVLSVDRTLNSSHPLVFLLTLAYRRFNYTACDLLDFSGASQTAYPCCVYVRQFWQCMLVNMHCNTAEMNVSLVEAVEPHKPADSQLETHFSAFKQQLSTILFTR